MEPVIRNFRSLYTPEGRAARLISLDGIRARHPEYDDERARRALFRLLLGEDVAKALWPDDAPVAP